MTGTQRFFANNANLIATATLSASSVLPASNTVSETNRVADGYGTISLSGAYTGANACTIDIQITSGGSGVHVSEAEYLGSGNGTISAITATGLTAQSIVVECVSTGTPGQLATIHLGEIQIKAKAAGTAGNGINIAITPSLTIGGKIGVLPKQINPGETGWSGADWDFGQSPIAENGELSTNELRVIINQDTAHVYRLYKTWDGQNWRYNMTPPSAREYRYGSSVALVSGTYTAAVTQGATTETYASHTTLYSLLNAMMASALVAIDGAVVNDRRPAGMGILDVPFRTSASAQTVSQSGSDTIQEVVLTTTPAAAAKNQVVKIKCTSSGQVGSEKWLVTSELLGKLGEAVSGRSFTSAVLDFTIPQVFSDETTSDITIASIRYASRTQTDEPAPPICLQKGTLGAAATTKTITLTYTRRPNQSCDCKRATITGGISAKLLGLEDLSVSVIDPIYKAKLEDLADYRAEFIANNTGTIIRTVPTLFEFDDNLTYATDPATYVSVKPTAANDNGHWYQIQASAGSTVVGYEPDWHTTGGEQTYQFADGTLSAIDMGMRDQTRFVAAEADIAVMDQALQILSSCLASIYSSEAALSEWAGLWQDVQIDLAAAEFAGAAFSQTILAGNYLERYRAKCDQIRLTADLMPNFFDAGNQGSAAWQDPGDSLWWEIDGYLPAFSNRIYHSAIRGTDGNIVSTEEFAFGLAIACPSALQEGDSVTIQIESKNPTYVVGDEFVVSVQTGQTLTSIGGTAGTDTVTWRVGPGFADYALTSGEPAYSNGGLAFQINRGGIPFVAGDKFTFSVENSLRMKWRKDAGAWSADTAIAATVALTNGLSVVFAAGVAPSWVTGDAWSFSVLQPYSPSYMQAPLPLDFGWKWSTAGETLSIDLGSAQTITACGILIHSLPAGATLALWGGSTVGATDWTEPLTWRVGPILALFSAHSSRYLRLVIGSATGGSMGWLWVGQPLAVSKPGGVTRQRYEHRMVRDGGINPGARRVGKGWGATVEWGAAMGWITQTDADALLSMIDSCKANNDYPIVFLPTYLDTTEGMLVRIADDEIEIVEQSGHQPIDAKRRINMSITMTPVLS